METVRKNSKKRQAILDVLCSTKKHPTAEMVYMALKPHYPELSLGTVYRNLSLLTEEGRIITVGTVDGQERFDACTAPHAHFVCRLCHRVDDLDVPDTVSGLFDRIEQDNNCQVENYNLMVSGVCSSCRGAEAKSLSN